MSKDVNQNQRRVDVKGILDDPKKRRKLMTGVIRATQAREGIETTQEQADDAYDAARDEHRQARKRVRT